MLLLACPLFVGLPMNGRNEAAAFHIICKRRLLSTRWQAREVMLQIAVTEPLSIGEQVIITGRLVWADRDAQHHRRSRRGKRAAATHCAVPRLSQDAQLDADHEGLLEVTLPLTAREAKFSAL